MNFHIFLKLSPQVIAIAVGLCLLTLISGCKQDELVSGYTAEDFHQRVIAGGGEFLSSLDVSRRDMDQLDRAMPGSRYYFGAVLADSGYAAQAAGYFEDDSASGSPTSMRSLRRLLDIRTDQQDWSAILKITHGLSGRRLRNPDEYWWMYSYRYEALLQTGRAADAAAELGDMQEIFPHYAGSPLEAHSLMYYRAMIAAALYSQEAIAPDDLEQAVLSYIFVPDARFGHEDLYAILADDSDENTWYRPWLEAKALLISGEASAALDLMENLLVNPLPNLVSDLSAYRDGEGFPRDLYKAGVESGQEIRAAQLFLAIAPSVPQVSQARYLEYAGRLYADAGDYTEASEILEQAYDAVQRHDPVDLLLTERIIWREAAALMRVDASVSSVLAVLSRVHSPEYFRDILGEYLTDLYRRQRWNDLYAILSGASGAIPDDMEQLLRISLYRTSELVSMRPDIRLPGLDELASAGISPMLAAGISSEDASTAFVSHLEERLEWGYTPGNALTRRMTGEADVEGEDLTQVVQGLAFWGLYSEITTLLADPSVHVDPEVVLAAVTSAYEAGMWYAGLQILESGIRSSVRYAAGPQPYILAAGGERKLLELLYPLGYRDLVEEYAAQYDADSHVFYALMREESRFDPEAGSHAGAQGLGQIIDSTASDIAARMRLSTYDLLDAETNIAMSLYYLQYLGGRFSTLSEVLSAYNAGQGRVDSWIRDFTRNFPEGSAYSFAPYIPFEETRNYTSRVLDSLAVYRLLYEPESLETSREELNGIIKIIQR